MTLLVNGESCRVPAGLDLECLLRHLGHQPQLVVVEYNGVILPRTRWAEQRVGGIRRARGGHHRGGRFLDFRPFQA